MSHRTNRITKTKAMIGNQKVKIEKPMEAKFSAVETTGLATPPLNFEEANRIKLVPT